MNTVTEMHSRRSRSKLSWKNPFTTRIFLILPSRHTEALCIEEEKIFPLFEEVVFSLPFLSPFILLRCVCHSGSCLCMSPAHTCLLWQWHACLCAALQRACIISPAIKETLLEGVTNKRRLSMCGDVHIYVIGRSSGKAIRESSLIFAVLMMSFTREEKRYRSIC